MSITRQSPRTVHLSGHVQAVNDLVAGAAITPGFLIERYNDSGTAKFRKHASAGAVCSKTVALNASMLNKGVDDDYAAGDLVEAAVLSPGSVAWMLVASGQTLVAGDYLESAGDGTLRKLASGVPLFQITEAKTSTALSRIRAEAL